MTAPAMAQPSEDSDGLHETLLNAPRPTDEMGTTDAPVKNVDPIVKEHGPLFVAGVNTIRSAAVQATTAAKYPVRRRWPRWPPSVASSRVQITWKDSSKGMSQL